MTTAQRETRDFARSGLKNPKVSSQLDGLASSIDLTSIGNPEDMQAAMDKINTYEHVKTISEGAVVTNMPKADDRAFAETFLAARNVLKMDDKRAMELAISTNRPISADNLPRVRMFQSELDAEVKNITDTTYGWDPSVGNYSEVYGKVSLLAERFVALGVEPKKAITTAATALKGSSVFYNGRLIGNVNGAMPGNFEASTGSYLDHIAEAFIPKKIADGDLKRSELGVRAVGPEGSRFLVTDDDGIPIEDDEGDMVYFTLKDLRDWETAQGSKKEAEGRAKVVEGNQAYKGTASKKRDAKERQQRSLREQSSPFMPSQTLPQTR